jgi:CBS-domain-containing membrane protein
MDKWIDGVISDDRKLAGSAGWKKIGHYKRKSEEEKLRVLGPPKLGRHAVVVVVVAVAAAAAAVVVVVIVEKLVHCLNI